MNHMLLDLIFCKWLMDYCVVLSDGGQEKSATPAMCLTTSRACPIRSGSSPYTSLAHMTTSGLTWAGKLMVMECFLASFDRNFVKSK